MKGMRYSKEEYEALRHEALLEKNVFPVDHQIRRLRKEIRERVQHLRTLKQKGFPAEDSRRVLTLMCRTLQVHRAYRRAMLKAVLVGRR